MRDAVNAYIEAGTNLLSAFKCPGQYFIKPITNATWRIYESEELHFLSYETDGVKRRAVIVKQDGRPMIYRTPDYVLVVVIDCIKIAIVLDHHREMEA